MIRNGFRAAVHGFLDVPCTMEDGDRKMASNANELPDAWQGKRESENPESSRGMGSPRLPDSEPMVFARPYRIGPHHYQCVVQVVNDMGLHARPATLLVGSASKFACDVRVGKGSDRVDGKSILQLLSLCAESGTKLALETRGPDAEAAIEELVALVSSGFQELGSHAAS